MKNNYSKNKRARKLDLHFPIFLVSLAISSLISLSAISQNVGINATGTPPDASAMLDVASSEKGLLVPRMTISDRENIVSPANGLIVYNTDCNLLNYYDCDTWRKVGDEFGFPNLLGAGPQDFIYGKTAVSENETGVLYEIPTVSGANVTYTWTVPSGASIVSGQGTDRIIVDYTSPGSGYVCVEVGNGCGSLAKTCLHIEICPLPAQPGVIAGSTTPNENSAGNTYSISAVPTANTYTWTVPTGATITAGQGTPSITVDFALGASNGNICVAANSDCGTGTSQCLALTMQCPVPTVPTASAGTNINPTDFDANWSASTGVVGYYLDVATDNSFTTFVSGFNNLSVGNVITYNVTGLTCATDYYYRVRAENACGLSSYSSTISVTAGSCWTCGISSFTDSRDSKSYQTVQIGTQCWMKENLNYDAGSGSYCYNNSSSNCTTYGRLYTWATVMNGSSGSSSTPSGVQGVCPTGWHMPSVAEWDILKNQLGSSTAGTQMKVTSGNSPSWNGTNTSGFSGLPAGYLYGGNYDSMGSYTSFWSTTESGSNAWGHLLQTSTSTLGPELNSKSFGWSVRCIKD